MDNQTPFRVESGVIRLIVAAALAAGLPAVAISGLHLCILHSTALEIGLLSISVFFSCFWTIKAKNRRQAWKRVVACFFFSLTLQLVYSTLLHSDSFPNALLDPSVRKQLQHRENERLKWSRHAQEEPARDMP